MNLGEIAGKLFGKHSSQRNGLQEPEEMAIACAQTFS